MLSPRMSTTTRFSILCILAVLSVTVLAAPQPQPNDWSGDWSDDSSGGSSGSWDGSGSDSSWDGFSLPSHYNKVRVAHAVLASAAWLLFFPLGAILIRTVETGWDLGDVRIHAAVQTAGSLVFAAGAGMGIWMAYEGQILSHYHPVIGMVLLGCVIIQPMTELLNARFYQRYPKVIFLAHVHIWFGRLLITVGIIQGGIGFAFSATLPEAKPELAPRVVYGVLAIIMWLLYVSLAIVWPEVKHTFGWWKGRQNRNGEEGVGLRNRNFTDDSAPSAIIRPKRARK